jgi:O-antigen/teichoic acid export membrane protein
MSAGLNMTAVTQTVITRVAMVIIGVATSVVTARALGPEGRGVFFYVFTFATLVTQFATLGAHSSNTVLVARDATLLRSLFSNSVWIALIAGSTFAIVGIAALAFTSTEPVSWRLLMCTVLLVPALVVNLLIANLYVGIGKMTEFNLINVAGGIASLFAACIGALLDFDAGELILLLTALNVLVSGALVAWTAARFDVPLRLDVGLLKSSFSFSARALLVNSLSFVVLRMNVLVLGFFAGPAEVGFYSIGAQVFDVATIVPVAFATVLFPAMFQTDSPWLLLRKSVIRVAIFMAVALVIGACLTPALLPLFFGAEFAPAVPVTLALLPGAWATGATSIVSQFLSAHGYPASQMLIWIGALVLMSTLVPFGAAQFGALGAAFVLSGVSLVVLVAMLFAAQRFTSAPLRVARGE